MDWKECCSRRIAKDVKPDIGMIASLTKSSKKKSIKYINLTKINECKLKNKIDY